jgi:hypothetical protein
MYVSVLDPAGAPVADLSPSDIVIREDAAVREVLRIAPASEPMQIAVLIDDSQAARDYIPDIRRALPPFIQALTADAPHGGRNSVALVTVGERPTIITDYTSDPAQLQKGIGRIFPRSGSGLYLLDGLIEVSRGFLKRGAARPVIVALTTEGPEFSSRYFDLVLKPLAASGAAFHAIAIGPPSSDAGDDARNRAVVLDEGTRASGGRYERVLLSSAVGRVLQQLAAELTHQYLVAYARPPSLIPPERITVSAARPGFTARGTVVNDPTRGGQR